MTSTSSPPETVCSMTDVLKGHLIRSAHAAARLSSDPDAILDLKQAAEQIIYCFARGGKLLICGNGGSMADAMHIAAEFVGRFKLAGRTPLPAIAFNDPPALTAIGNDFGYNEVFSRMVHAYGTPKDLLWTLSTSGSSVNVLHAMRSARTIGMPVIGFSSYQARDTDFRALCDVVFMPLVRDTALIQQLHMTAAHAICDAVEQELTG